MTKNYRKNEQTRPYYNSHPRTHNIARFSWVYTRALPKICMSMLMYKSDPQYKKKKKKKELFKMYIVKG